MEERRRHGAMRGEDGEGFQAEGWRVGTQGQRLAGGEAVQKTGEMF